MTLRTSITYRGSSDSTNPLGVPFIVYGASEGVFYLHAYGGCQAAHADPCVLAACLIGERAEPGYIRRILSPETDCSVAILAPDDRAERTARLANSREHARREAADRAERTQRRGQQIDLTRIGLDDL